MFSCCPTETILGVMIQAAQSKVGNVLSNLAMCPPIEGSLSTRYTVFPASAISRAACIPAIPPPMTKTLGFISTKRLSKGSWCITLNTAALTSSLAFSVATCSSSCTQETCSRILAIWKRYGLSPAFSQAFLKVFSCILGEQEATTTLLRL